MVVKRVVEQREVVKMVVEISVQDVEVVEVYNVIQNKAKWRIRQGQMKSNYEYEANSQKGKNSIRSGNYPGRRSKNEGICTGWKIQFWDKAWWPHQGKSL